MDFELTDDQAMVQKMVREFAEKRVAPEADARNEAAEFDRALYDEMVKDLGLSGICYPEEYEGAGGDYLSYILAIEELSRVDSGIAISLSATVSLGSWPILKFGTDEQKAKYLAPIASGEKMAAFGLTEPNAGTDAASQQTVAVLDGDHYVINGSKMFITNGGEAETYIIFAMTDKSKGTKGITAFIIEKGMEGFTFGKKENKMGIHSSQTMELVFQDLKVPVADRLGKEGEGFKIAMTTLDGGRIGVAAQALGIAQGALDHAVQYSKERVQFGKPISRNQGISFKLADMQMKISAARYLVYRAACLKDAGKPYSVAAAEAKCVASDVAMYVTTEAVQIYGGYGYIKEYPVERFMRDAKITQIYEGTNEVQRMVISGSLLR